ncbi:MAG: fatty acid desaturase [Bacteroidia bacterium]|nr:fatty acid desaturase [Bacteroidia bacterium]
MRALSAISDPIFDPKKPYNSLDRFFLKFIRDERDLPFIYTTLKITFIMMPIGILLFFPFIKGWVWWLLAVGYFYLNNLVLKGPFGLMFHCTNHRKWFKKKYHVFNYYLPWVVAPFFGQSPETYFCHHINMHHPENNLEMDKSSTMGFQRDKFGDFMKYFGEFLFLGIYELASYFQWRKNSRLRNKAIFGELSFFLMCGLLGYFISWQATIWVFLLPLLLYRFVAMMGNWAQHAFVDPDEPGNSYKNSLTCINVKYNHKCWNDGYHISHHVRPAMHWTDHPNYFLKTLDAYAENKSIIFEGLDFLGVFVTLMRGDYQKLADHFVNVNNTFKNDEEVIAHLKRRTAKIVRSPEVIRAEQEKREKEAA